MSVNLEGQIKGISLISFLQIVQMEKLTCTLAVSYSKKKGSLFIKDGEIISSKTNTGLKNLDAAFDILCWDDPSIELKKNMPAKERHINMPLMSLLMEATRLKDELVSKGELEEEDIILEEAGDGDFEKTDLDSVSLEDNLDSDLDSVSLLAEGSDDISTSLDGIHLEMDIPDQKNTESDDSVADTIDQEIPDELLIEEIAPSQKVIKPEKTGVDQVDLTSSTPSKHLYDFTESIVSTDAQEAIYSEYGDKAPSIEDFIEKKSSKSKIIIAIISLIILTGGVIGEGIYYINQKKLSSAYEKMEKNLNSLKFEEQKIALLKNFISNYPDTKYGNLADKQLSGLLNMNEKDDYKTLLSNIKKLDINGKYPERAIIYYDNFLQKYPKGNYFKKIKAFKNSIPKIMQKYKFNEIKKISFFDTIKKLNSIKEYRKEFPGIHSEELDKMIEKTGSSYIKILKKQISKCDDLHKYQNIIKKIDRFKSFFFNQKQRLLVEKLRRKLEKEYLALALLNTAKKETGSLLEEKKFLNDYIASHNIYSLVIIVKERIRAIDETIKSEKTFHSIMKYADNNNYPLINRINKLTTYIYSNTQKRYKEKASKKIESLKDLLNKTKLRPVTSKKIEQKPKEKKTESAPFDLKYAYKNALKIKKKMDKSRFLAMNNFSFVDTFTGKTWMIVDSDDIFKNRCFSFKEAKKEIKNLNLDGYKDWRLPTERELLTLFKNKPFFPAEKNKWYWSSNIFEKGFNTYSAVVTNDKTETRKKEFKDIFSNCGNFKLIRP